MWAPMKSSRPTRFPRWGESGHTPEGRHAIALERVAGIEPAYTAWKAGA